MPTDKGNQINAVLTFSDKDKAIEVQPVKGSIVTVPYSQIDRCSYQYTKKHRIGDSSIATAPLGVGIVMMFTKAKSHWLEIDYREQELPKVLVLRMDKQNYLRVLDALKEHTGKDAEVLGNADKR